jgi:hypothetical protein
LIQALGDGVEQVDWARRMARMPDEDLIAIASAREVDGYHQSAIDAATAEIEKRTPDQSVIERIEQQVAEDRQFEANKAIIPLSNAGWVAFVLFGIFLFWPCVAAYVLYHRGYHRKAKEALWAIPLSIALWWAVFAGLAYFFA